MNSRTLFDRLAQNFARSFAGDPSGASTSQAPALVTLDAEIQTDSPEMSSKGTQTDPDPAPAEGSTPSGDSAPPGCVPKLKACFGRTVRVLEAGEKVYDATQKVIACFSGPSE